MSLCPRMHATVGIKLLGDLLLSSQLALITIHAEPQPPHGARDKVNKLCPCI